MGLFDIFRKTKTTENTGTVSIVPLNGGPSSSFDGINKVSYSSDILVQAIRCKSNEFKKLVPKHVRIHGDEKTVVNSQINYLLQYPNDYMTQSDFLEKITILLELNKNVYIYPAYHYDEKGNKVFDGLYPLMPSSVDMVKDKGNRLYYKFTFGNGYIVTLSVSDVIHWKKDYGVNDYFGGNGIQDSRNVSASLAYYDTLCKGVAKALNASYQINGLLKINTMLSTDKQDIERNNFVSKLQNNESGIMVTDMKTEYVNMPRDVKLLDAETIKFMYQNVLRLTGTPLAILSGDYTKIQKEAYYEHALEGDIKSLGEAMTKVLFSKREKEVGNKILLYPKDINFMTTDEKIKLAQVAMPAGALTKDEFRELFGYEPLPDGEGKKISQGYNTLLNVSTDETEKDEGEKKENE